MPVLTSRIARCPSSRPCARRSRRRGLRRRARCGRSRWDRRVPRPAPPGARAHRSRRCSVAGAISGTSPYSTSTLRVVGQPGIACCTAWPVPSCGSCSAHCRSGWSSKAACTASPPWPCTTWMPAGCSARAVSITCASIGRPAIVCSTFGSADFMRLPSPAARITTCRGAGMGVPASGDCRILTGPAATMRSLFRARPRCRKPPDDPRVIRTMTLGRHARHYLLIGGVQWLVDWGVLVAPQPLGHGDRAGQRRRPHRRRAARLLAQRQADLRRRRDRDRPHPAAAVRADVAGHDHGQHLVDGRDRRPRSA